VGARHSPADQDARPGLGAPAESRREGRKAAEVLAISAAQASSALSLQELSVAPARLAVVTSKCSHGHFDHNGIEVLIECADDDARASLAAAQGPIPWIRPQAIPSVSKRALEDAGLEVIEEAQPSFQDGAWAPDRCCLMTRRL
jgi:hypothetical protein